MTDPSISLRVSTSGTEDAAKAIGRVDEATGSLAESTAAQAEASQDAADAADAQAESQRRLEEASRQYQDQVEENRRQAQREADVVEATRRRDAREAESAAPPGQGSSLPEILGAAAAGAAIGQTLKATADALRDTVRQMQEFKEATGQALTTTDALLVAVAETYEVVTNPLDALIEGFKSLAGLDDLQDSITQAAQMEARLKAVLETRRQIAEQARAFSFAFFLQRERQEIDEQTAALQRQIQVLNARRGLIDAQGTAQDAAAIRAGANVNDVASAAIQRQAEAAIAALEDQAVQARAALERAKAEEQSAIAAAVTAASEGREQEAAQARLAADAATAEVASLGEDLRNLVDNVIPLQEAEIRTTASARLAEIGDNVGRAFAAEAQNVVDVLQAQATEQGGVLSRSAADAMAGLAKVLEDGVIRPEEIGQVASAMQILRNSVENRDTEIFQATSSMSTTLAENASLFRTLATRDAQTRAELATVRRMVEDLQR